MNALRRPSDFASILEDRAAVIAALTGAHGARVDVLSMGVTDRADELSLTVSNGRVAPNGACRLFRAADGWMALNLARDSDRELVPAWLECAYGDEPWSLVDAHAGRRRCVDLRDRAALLGLPASIVGEVTCSGEETPPPEYGARHGAPHGDRVAPPRVIDLSALWAGPLCGAVLAACGAEVIRVESVRRPDPTRVWTPRLFANLNGQKSEIALDLSDPGDQARLREHVLSADVVITSARPRALRSIGLDEATLARAGIVWVAITGYGLSAPGRVAFGDDAAAAGGHVGWNEEGEPGFIGDALADPLTGLDAAIGALVAMGQGRGGVIDARMAHAAARAAARMGLVNPS